MTLETFKLHFFQGEVVMKWAMNVPEMVAYRSFRPFYPLMAENQPESVQLWAVWALHHVCCNKGKNNGKRKPRAYV